MHFNKIGYKEHVIFPINLHHKSRNGLPWKVGNPQEDWMDKREGIELEANQPNPGI